jgi:hypothetical protein
MVYGLMKDLDLFITVPNVLGTFFCLSQIFIWFYFEVKNKNNFNENNNQNFNNNNFEEEKKFLEK